MIRAGSRSLCVVVVATLGVLFVARAARADAGASIHYESEDQLELARRIASELKSEGYTVDVSTTLEPSPCDESGPTLVSVPRGTKAWIRLRTDPSNPDTIVASICYLGAQPFIQQAAPSAPRTEAQRLALETAEALNGLRSRLPPIESAPERVERRLEAPRDDRRAPEPPPPATPTATRLVNRAALGMAIVWNLPDLPSMPGVSGRATLGLSQSVSLAIDAFVPVTGQEVESDTVKAKVRTSWVRVGPRLGGALGDFDVSGAVLAGPALTWATAAASAPRTGTTDLTPGAIVTLGAALEYPRRSTVYAYATACASVLLPGVEVELGEGPAPRGSLPVEAGIGLGARWGGPH